MQVGPRCIGSKQFHFDGQFFPEVLFYVLNYLLFGCGSKTGDRYALFKFFLYLEVFDKITYVKIIHPEIMSPR